jgi:putative alpha-1,2-mannosidase
MTAAVVRAALHFGARDLTTPVQVRVGVSMVDLDGAATNLETELPDFGHDVVAQAATEAWAAQLRGVRLFGVVLFSCRAGPGTGHHDQGYDQAQTG